jgi:hypothetical protein
MQAADARVYRLVGQVDLRYQIACCAPPPDAHLLADEADPPFGGTHRELDGRAGHAARRSHAVVVDAIRGHQHRPGNAGERRYGCCWRGGGGGPDGRGGKVRPGRDRPRWLRPGRGRGRLRPGLRRRGLRPGCRRRGRLGTDRGRRLGTHLRPGRRFRPRHRRGRRVRPDRGRRGRRRRRRPRGRREQRFEQAYHPGPFRRLGCLWHVSRLRNGRPGGLAAGSGRRRQAGRGRAGRGRRRLRAAPGRKRRLGLGHRREQRFGRAGGCRTGRCRLPRLGGSGEGTLRLIAERGEGPAGGNPESARLAELTGHGRPAARATVAATGHEPPGRMMLSHHAVRTGQRAADPRPAYVTEVTTRRVVALWAHCPHTHPFEPTFPLGSPRAGYAPRACFTWRFCSVT